MDDITKLNGSLVLYNTPIPRPLSWNDSAKMATIRHVSVLAFTTEIYRIILMNENIHQG